MKNVLNDYLTYRSTLSNLIYLLFEIDSSFRGIWECMNKLSARKEVSPVFMIIAETCHQM